MWPTEEVSWGGQRLKETRQLEIKHITMTKKDKVKQLNMTLFEACGRSRGLKRKSQQCLRHETTRKGGDERYTE